jgi:hypothetical protein
VRCSLRRYKWLSEEAGRKFGGIYKLQQQGVAFTTPEAWLVQLDIYNVTQQRAADYMSVGGLAGFSSYCYMAQDVPERRAGSRHG